MQMMVSSRLAKRAFSLVELSIVLVILGLLVGGILSGQSLIRAAELRSVVTQYQKYMAATYSFLDKYFALPGDMTNAQSFWGIANATPATCYTTASTDSKTCNGNGDGIIWVSTGSNEIYRFWQHLANAGLIEGTYDGITHGANDVSSTSANSPAGRLSSSLWFIGNWGSTMTGSTAWFDGNYGNRLSTGGITVDNEPGGKLFKPEELWNIDTKLDDGMPGTGKVISSDWSGCTNAASSADINTTYKLTATGLLCFVLFPRAF